MRAESIYINILEGTLSLSSIRRKTAISNEFRRFIHFEKKCCQRESFHRLWAAFISQIGSRNCTTQCSRRHLLFAKLWFYFNMNDYSQVPPSEHNIIQFISNHFSQYWFSLYLKYSIRQMDLKGNVLFSRNRQKWRVFISLGGVCL